MTIHYCTEAHQPDILIGCTRVWDTPAWTQPKDLQPNVYATDRMGWLYTFESRKVTCRKCQLLTGPVAPELPPVTKEEIKALIEKLRKVAQGS